MQLYSVLDNGGETFDRYTLSFINHETGESICYGASENPFHPQGFGQYVGEYLFPDTEENPNVGLPISESDLPEQVQKLIRQIEEES